MATIKETARALADAFETATRDNGDEFQRLRDGSPEWMKEAIYAAHRDGEMMPNDWSYKLADLMASHIADTLDYDSENDLHDIISNGADILVPDYNGERLAWLASNLNRASYVDEMIEECGWPKSGGLYLAIAYGIAHELQMIGAALVAAIEGEAEQD